MWFSEGGKMEHGATADQDVTFVFTLNNPFGIEFCADPPSRLDAPHRHHRGQPRRFV